MLRLVALGLAVFVLLAGTLPHAHEGVGGRHACAACVTGQAEPPEPSQPGVGPRLLPEWPAPQLPVVFPVTGASRDAVPGQSPPLA